MGRVAGPMSEWTWSEGIVDTTEDHFKITYGDDSALICLVGRGEGQTFLVEFLVEGDREESREILKRVRYELDFYLVDKGEPDPWKYAIYHCSTVSNAVSKVHWSYYLRTQQRELPGF